MFILKLLALLKANGTCVLQWHEVCAFSLFGYPDQAWRPWKRVQLLSFIFISKLLVPLEATALEHELVWCAHILSPFGYADQALGPWENVHPSPVQSGLYGGSSEFW